jgi:hypothetical protein
MAAKDSDESVPMSKKTIAVVVVVFIAIGLLFARVF